MSVYYDPKESPERRGIKAIIYIILILIAASVMSVVKAQPLAGFRALQKGDSVPDLTLSNLVNTKDPAETIRITSKDDNLTVLIFFGTWCGSCRAEFPSHQALQNRFSKEMQLVIVSDESRAKLSSFFQTARYTDGTPYSFPCVAEDKHLKALFPHRFIPHLVWLKSGRVVATTSGEELTAENITAVLQGSTPPYQKKDKDPTKPLFFNDDLPPSATFSLFVKGKIDGLSSGGRFRKSGDILYGRLVHNWHLNEMYQHAASEIMPGFSKKRVLISIKDSSGFFRPAKPSLSDTRENSCTYEIRVPLKEADSLYAYMLKDLNRYTPYQASIEKRKVKCYVLTVLPGYKDRLKTRGGEAEFSLFRGPIFKMVNYSTQILLINLNELDFLPLPVVDETGLNENIDLSFASVPTSITDLKSAFLKQGLKLTEKVRELEMLCIKDDK
ncbi:TlpA family protein disulfide reductase [Desertivirga arenae]|uniref:TlpA family protein disulfide reductase n=1 Tax=Desertivirga arenae TaxID=2810309 RepID=UPI001A95DFFA|nr:redoxin domain-containing protein [Pedobacter sp. SYSU D00823]